LYSIVKVLSVQAAAFYVIIVLLIIANNGLDVVYFS